MRFSDESGSSTAEFAVLLPAVAIMLSLALCFGVVGIQQIQVQQAAGAMARELARGEDDATARASGVRLAGNQARFSLSTSNGYSQVHVSKTVRLPIVGSLQVHGQASVAVE
ncbi:MULTISPECIES: TadE family type IV pilus minor pilin [Glutamicibacter]|nr:MULTISPECIES: TadE family type IV pilus minor pilin [Glutamicibacter]UTM46503.1 chromosome partitioning protein [Glutamicibacter mysorens]